MARRVEVEIVGDSRQLERAFKRSSRAASDFSRNVSRAGRGGVLDKTFGRLKGQIGAAGAALLGGGIVVGIKSTIDAASDLNEQMSKTQQVFGDSADAIVEWSKTSASAMGQSQRQALATASSFGALFRPIGLTGKEAAEQSKKLTELGADLASFYNTDVQSALDAIRSGLVGESEPLRKYGVQLSETRVQQEALNETGKQSVKQLTNHDKALARIALIYKDTTLAQGDFQRTSGGLANQLRIAGANIDDLRTHIGELLIPAVTEAVNRFNDWIKNTENQKRVLDTVKTTISAVKGVVDVFVGAFQRLNDITGSTKHSLELLFGVLVLYKTAKIAGSLANIATQIANIGTNAEKSRKQAGGGAGGKGGALLWGGAKIVGPAVAALTIAELIINTKQYRIVSEKAKESLGKRVGKNLADLFVGNIFDQGRRAYGAWKDFNDKVINYSKHTAEEVANAYKGMSADAITADRDLQRSLKSTFAENQRFRLQQDPGGGRDRPKITRAQSNRFFDAAVARTLGRAQYATLTQQLGIYRQVAAKIRARIAITRDITRKLKLEDQLLSVIASEKDVRQQLAQRALDALQLNVDRAGLTKTLTDDIATLERLRKALIRQIKVTKDNAELQSQLIGVEGELIAKREEQAERRKEAARKRQEALSTRLFSILGFGPGGAPKIPNINQLRKQFAALGPELAKATPRIKREAAAIEKVLRRSFLPPDIRAKAREMLNDLTRELKGAADTEKRTPFRVAEPSAILRGLGLDPRQAELLRARIEALGPGRRIHPKRTEAFAGAGAGAGVYIAGNLNVYGVQNVRELENQITKRQAARARNRRGAR